MSGYEPSNTAFRGLVGDETGNESKKRESEVAEKTSDIKLSIGSEDHEPDSDVLYGTSELLYDGSVEAYERTCDFIRFIISDWPEFGPELLKRYNRLLVIQLTLIFIIAFDRLYDKDRMNASVLMEILMFFLTVISILTIPFALYVSIDFVYFSCYVYIWNGIRVRYAVYKNRLVSGMNENSFSAEDTDLFSDDGVDSGGEDVKELSIELPIVIQDDRDRDRRKSEIGMGDITMTLIEGKT